MSAVKQSDHLSAAWPSIRSTACVTMLLMLATAGSCNGAEPTKPRPAPRTTPQAVQMTFDEALRTAQPCAVAKASLGQWSSYHYALSFAATPAFAALHPDEILFALMRPQEIPQPEFVQNPSVSGLEAVGTGFELRSRRYYVRGVFINYAHLTKFNTFYQEFMTRHSSPLQRQAAATEFQQELLRAHAAYVALASASYQTLFVSTGYTTFSETEFNVPGRAMRVDVSPAMNSLLLAIGGEQVTQWDYFKRFIRFHKRLEELHARMSVEEAERLIALTKEREADVTLLYRTWDVPENPSGTGWAFTKLVRGGGLGNNHIIPLDIVGVKVVAGDTTLIDVYWGP